MSRPSKVLVVALIALGTGLAAVPAARSFDWPWVFFPDLRLASVQPSSIGPKFARITITNDGYASSSPCYVRVAVKLPTPVVKYVPISSMPAQSGLGLDVYMGISLLAGPGLETEAKVDVFNWVTELNESNNWASYLAPVW